LFTFKKKNVVNKGVQKILDSKYKNNRSLKVLYYLQVSINRQEKQSELTQTTNDIQKEKGKVPSTFLYRRCSFFSFLWVDDWCKIFFNSISSESHYSNREWLAQWIRNVQDVLKRKSLINCHSFFIWGKNCKYFHQKKVPTKLLLCLYSLNLESK